MLLFMFSNLCRLQSTRRPFEHLGVDKLRVISQIIHDELVNQKELPQEGVMTS